jgi:hypothetical protein
MTTELLGKDHHPNNNNEIENVPIPDALMPSFGSPVRVVYYELCTSTVCTLRTGTRYTFTIAFLIPDVILAGYPYPFSFPQRF